MNLSNIIVKTIMNGRFFMLNKAKYSLFTLLMIMVLSACTSNESMQDNLVSPTFAIPVMFDGEEGQNILRGEQGKLGFLIGSGLEKEEVELLPLVANEPNKYMWHFWGQDLNGKSLKVIGTNIETNEEAVIIDNYNIAGALNGADAHVPSSMVFPNSGIWELDVYVEKELFGNVVVEVQ